MTNRRNSIHTTRLNGWFVMMYLLTMFAWNPREFRPGNIVQVQLDAIHTPYPQGPADRVR